MPQNYPELDNLVDLGALKPQPPRKSEVDRILQRGGELLEGALNPANPLSVRFSLAYSAAHAFAHGALRRAGYRSRRRGVVFQCIGHVTLARPTSDLLFHHVAAGKRKPALPVSSPAFSHTDKS